MGENSEIILSIIKGFFGKPRNDSEDKRGNFEFNCPSDRCKSDRNKFNLTYHIDWRIFSCWKCKLTGSVHTITKKYGSKTDYEKLKLILPFNDTFRTYKKKDVSYEFITCELPEGFRPLTKSFDSWSYRAALKYLIEDRKIDMKTIEKYGIGYSEEGDRKHRIIFPSYNVLGRMNYYDARSYLKNTKRPYMKPDSPDKEDIIFNESNINWDLPIFLVEGIFDMLRVPNAIPLLGKEPSEYLISKLLKHNCKIIICLDEDAIEDAYRIYSDLSSLGLDVYFVDMKNKGDLSEVHEKYGPQAVIDTIKTLKKIDFDFLIERMLKY